MPVSSTFSTSAPKSASSSEQKPPGNRRERSRTRRPSSGRLTPGSARLGRCRASTGPRPRVAGRRPTSSVICRALAISSPLEAAMRPSGRYRLSSRPTRIEPPRVRAAATSIHWSREIPITPQWEPAGMLSTIAARLRAVGGMPPTTPITQSTCRGVCSTPMSISGARLPTWPTSKHSCSGLMPSSFIASSSSMISLEGVLEDHVEDELFARAGVLGVVHRAHVQGRHLRTARSQVFDPLGHRDADRAGREVDDHRIADLAADRVGDRLEVLDLVAGGAVRFARVDVDITPPSSTIRRASAAYSSGV